MGNKFKRVYVAGPYSSNNIIGCLDNIREGLRVSTEVLLNGLTPFCPWQDFHFQLMLRGDERLAVTDYYRYSMAWLDVSDAMLVLPGWETSKGTLTEIERAKELNIPMFFSLDDLLKANKG